MKHWSRRKRRSCSGCGVIGKNCDLGPSGAKLLSRIITKTLSKALTGPKLRSLEYTESDSFTAEECRPKMRRYSLGISAFDAHESVALFIEGLVRYMSSSASRNDLSMPPISTQVIGREVHEISDLAPVMRGAGNKGPLISPCTFRPASTRHSHHDWIQEGAATPQQGITIGNSHDLVIADLLDLCCRVANSTKPVL